MAVRVVCGDFVACNTAAMDDIKFWACGRPLFSYSPML